MDITADFLLYFFLSFCCYLLGALSHELSTLCRRAFFVSLYDYISIVFLFLGFIVSIPVYLLNSCECRRVSDQAESRSQSEVQRLRAEAQLAQNRLKEYARTEKSARGKIFTEAYKRGQASVSTSSYDSGYNAGYQDAENEVYDRAYKVGYNDGLGNIDESKVKSAYSSGYMDGHRECLYRCRMQAQQYISNYQTTPAFDAVKSYDFSTNPRLYSAAVEPIRYAAPFSLAAKTYGEGDIIYDTTLYSCTCPDFQFRKIPCKHMFHLALDFGLLDTLDGDKLREAVVKMQAQFSKLRKQQEKTTRSIQRLHDLQQNVASISAPGSSAIEVPRNTELPVLTASQDRKRCKMLSDYEYSSLPPAERYQLALEYELERKKNRPEIGKAFERYVGYCCEQRQYSVVYNGATEKKHDLGRDLIAISPDRKTVYVIQCKYYAADKEVHENAVMQLFGSVSMFAATYPGVSVFGVLVASCPLSRDAKSCVSQLKSIQCFENVHADLRQYPAVKCAISSSGTKHFYLPFDSCYDTVVAEHYELTVSGAMSKGFTRALKPAKPTMSNRRI